MKKNLLLGALALFASVFVLYVGGVAVSAPVASAGQSSQAGQADGSVVGIYTSHGRITLKHGAIESLGMPAMTMVFRVADPSMLTPLKTGDGVRFTVVRVDNFFTVTQLTRR